MKKQNKELTTKDFHKIVDNWFESMLGKDWKEGYKKNAN